MAHGFPDDFGQSIWPKYGTPLYNSRTANLDPGVSADVLTISGQGLLFMLEARVDCTVHEIIHVLTLQIDSEYMVSTVLGTYLAENIPTPPYSELIMDRYCLDDFKWHFHLRREIPFQNTVILYMKNMNAVGGNSIFASVHSAHYVIT
jgi:hypothetical protein